MLRLSQQRGNDVVPHTSVFWSVAQVEITSCLPQPATIWLPLNIQHPLLSMTSRSGHELPRVLAPFPPDNLLRPSRPVPRRTKRSNACIGCRTRRVKVIPQSLSSYPQSPPAADTIAAVRWDPSLRQMHRIGPQLHVCGRER